MSLSPNTIQASSGSRKVKRRVGRGDASTRGNFSGRGMNGQRSRSGGKGGLKLKGLKTVLQSTPKLRGFKSKFIKPTEVRLTDLDNNFNDGDVVNVVVLKAKNILRKNDTSAKVVFKGELKKKLTLEGIGCTVKAKELIEKNGGEVK